MCDIYFISLNLFFQVDMLVFSIAIDTLCDTSEKSDYVLQMRLEALSDSSDSFFPYNKSWYAL